MYYLKGRDWQSRFKKYNPTVYCSQETQLTFNHMHRLKINSGKDIAHNQESNKAGVVISITHKIDLRANKIARVLKSQV